MHIQIEVEQCNEVEWMAEVPDLNGLVAYGYSRREAYRAAQVLALRTLADLIEAKEVRFRNLSLTLADV
jgi:predicted RNase H-like HicB family nuclease